jgi:hypothetical protein
VTDNGADAFRLDALQSDSGEALTQLQASFPQFWIWEEITYGRARYIARSRHPGIGPHTVITPDPDELRAALAR